MFNHALWNGLPGERAAWRAALGLSTKREQD